MPFPQMQRLLNILNPGITIYSGKSEIIAERIECLPGGIKLE